MKQALLLLGLLTGGFAASAQWVRQPVPYPNPAYFNLGLAAVDANVAWTSLVDIGQVTPTLNYARTTNGGTTWSVASVPGTVGAEFITDLQARSATTAWAAVATAPDDLTGGRLLRTTDGGTTWATVTTPAQFRFGIPVYVRFFSATQGVAIGEALQGNVEIYTTADGGTTWTAVPAANIPGAQPDEQVYELLPLVSVAGNSLWFVTSRGRVFYTSNLGQNWAVSPLSLSANEVPEAVAFRDASNGLVMLDDGQLFQTNNGGATWTRILPSGAYHTIGLDAVPGTSTYVATGYAGSGTGPGLGTGAGSSYSTDDGQTWTAIETNTNHALVDFVSPTVGWAAGVNLNGLGRITSGTGMNKYIGPALAKARAQTLAVQVAPNPSADGRFRLSLPTGPAAELRVHDVLGRLLLTRQLPASPSAPVTLDLSPYRAGVYTLDVRSAAGQARQKLVVQ